MKFNLHKYLNIIFIGIIFIILMFKDCDGKVKDNGIIVTPPKVGGFDYYKPIELDSPNYIYITDKGDTINFENPLNQELKDKYELAEKENDSLKLKLMYFEAIQTRKYKQVFDNKDLTATVFANTTGTLDSLKLDYVIKSDTIKIKQPVFRLLGGLSFESNINTLKPAVGLNLGIQNKRGNIITGGINTNQDITIGYYHNILTIKK